MVSNIVILEIDDREFLPGQNGFRYVGQIYGPLPKDLVRVQPYPGERCCRIYFSVPDGVVIGARNLDAGIDLVRGMDHPEVVDTDTIVPAPDWLIELAEDISCWDIDDLKNRLASYLRDSLKSPQTGGQACRKVIHRGDWMYFNAREFAYSLGIRNTRRMSVLSERLSAVGVLFRQSLTIYSGGKRSVMKMAKIRAKDLIH